VINKLTIKTEDNTYCLQIIFYIIVITALIFNIPIRIIMACYLLNKNICDYKNKKKLLESYHFRKANQEKIILSSYKQSFYHFFSEIKP